MNQSESFAVGALEDLGAIVTVVPSGTEQSPDFIVELGGWRYLVELKSKLEDPYRESLWRDDLQGGAIAEDVDPIRRGGTISTIVDDAVGQLRAYQGTGVDLRLVWLLGWGRKAKLYSTLFQASIFGSTDVSDFGPGGAVYPCFYFTHSDFFKHRDILDGAIVSYKEHAALCLNTYSPRIDRLRTSTLATAFGEAVIDPVEMEKKGCAFVADTDIDRKDSPQVLRYLQTKYNRPHLINMQMNYFGATVLGPTK